MNTELLTLAAETRLAQHDLLWVRDAARREPAQATAQELREATARRDAALDAYEEAEALADEAAPLFAPRPWLADNAYVPAESRDEADRAFAEELQASPVATEAEQDWAAEVLTPAEVVVSARSAAEALIAAGLARGGWAAQSARDLRDAIAAGRASELDSRIARLRRDLAS